MLSRVKLISEPWDIGPGGYQLGNHPPGFAEWNDRFRDGIRRYWRGDEGQRSDFAGAPRGLGRPLRPAAARRPWASINYVASHDGFTLADTVSYAERHNEANGEDNHDGHADNYSANWGVEGPTDDPAILDTRQRLQRAHARHRVPGAGHAHAAGRRRVRPHAERQQQRLLPGQRDLVARLEAGRGRRRAATLAGFVAGSSTLRRRHPVLRAPRFLHGKDEPVAGHSRHRLVRRVRRDQSPTRSWNNPEERAWCCAAPARNGDGAVSILTACCSTRRRADQLFRLPPPQPCRRALLLDSAEPDAPSADSSGDDLMVGPRSVVLTVSSLKDRPP